MKKLCTRFAIASLFIIFTNLQAIRPIQEKQKKRSFAQKWLTPEVQSIIVGEILLTLSHSTKATQPVKDSLRAALYMLLTYTALISSKNAFYNSGDDQAILAFVKTPTISIATLACLEALGASKFMATKLKLCK